ncbi:MFS transporter, partial [Stenotrophomonas maltophilia]
DTAVGLVSGPGFAKLVAYRLFALLSYLVVGVTGGCQIYYDPRNPFSVGRVAVAEVVLFLWVARFAGFVVENLPRR